ncbi:unnamed protein product, partial [Phaeothamnion confervicola]
RGAAPTDDDFDGRNDVPESELRWVVPSQVALRRTASLNSLHSSSGGGGGGGGGGAGGTAGARFSRGGGTSSRARGGGARANSARETDPKPRLGGCMADGPPAVGSADSSPRG